MRVLFTARAGLGHIHPLLPLARALREAGHEVAMVSVEAMRADVERERIPFFPAGINALGDPATMAAVNAVPLERQRAFIFGRVFAGIEVEARLPELQSIVAEWNPDLLVHEQSEMTGAIVAAKAGIPHVTVSFGVMTPAEAIEIAEVSVEPHWRKVGLAPEPRCGLYTHLYLDTCPPTLQTKAISEVRTRRALRPVPYGGDSGESPGALRDLKAPVVYVTLGTVFGRDAGLFKTIVEGVESEAGSVVVTVGGRIDPTDLGPQPPHVHVHTFIPQARVLALADVMVTHGGSGSMLGGLGAGLPLLMVPQGADQFLNSDRVAAAGAGLRILSSELSVGSVRSAIRRLLQDPSHREAARRIQVEIEAMPMPAEHVGTLEALAAQA